MDVAYKIDAAGQLTASNKLILNQLTFGDKVASAGRDDLAGAPGGGAAEGPQGVINLDLPVSGSLNDPQFSLGSLIGKVFVNLLVKARRIAVRVADRRRQQQQRLSEVRSEPGTATLTKSGIAAIDKVAKALTNKPTLNKQSIGAADRSSSARRTQQAAFEVAARREAPRGFARRHHAGGGAQRTGCRRQAHGHAVSAPVPRRAPSPASALTSAPPRQAALPAQRPARQAAQRPRARQGHPGRRDGDAAEAAPAGQRGCDAQPRAAARRCGARCADRQGA